jgi:hypothetical protein
MALGASKQCVAVFKREKEKAGPRNIWFKKAGKGNWLLSSMDQ